MKTKMPIRKSVGKQEAEDSENIAPVACLLDINLNRVGIDSRIVQQAEKMLVSCGRRETPSRRLESLYST